MTENTSENGPTGNETPSATETSTNSEENKNTSGNTKTLFDKGFGVGKEKGQKELFEQLGVSGLDDLQTIIKSHKEREDAAKSTEQKLADIQASFEDMKSKHAEVETKLEFYVARDREKAKKLYDSLSEEDRMAFDTMDVPLEKAMPVLERFSSKLIKRKVGNPVSPNPENTNTSESALSMDEMVKEYRKKGIKAIHEMSKDIIKEEN